MAFKRNPGNLAGSRSSKTMTLHKGVLSDVTIGQFEGSWLHIDEPSSAADVNLSAPNKLKHIGAAPQISELVILRKEVVLPS